MAYDIRIAGTDLRFACDGDQNILDAALKAINESANATPTAISAAGNAIDRIFDTTLAVGGRHSCDRCQVEPGCGCDRLGLPHLPGLAARDRDVERVANELGGLVRVPSKRAHEHGERHVEQVGPGSGSEVGAFGEQRAPQHRPVLADPGG